MRRLILRLPFALLTLCAAQAHSDPHHPPTAASLEAHVHGDASLDVVLDGETLELQLKSPALNLIGFEHGAKSPQEHAQIATAKQALENPTELFGIPKEECSLTATDIHSPLFKPTTTEHDHGHHASDGHSHHDIQAHYRLSCPQPDNLKQLDLSGLFQRFPGTETIKLQLIGPNGQKGQELTATSPRLSF